MPNGKICNVEEPCNLGQGPCTSGEQCKNDFICFDRSTGEDRNGYDFSNVPDDFDICVESGGMKKLFVLAFFFITLCCEKLWLPPPPKKTMFGGREGCRVLIVSFLFF